MSKKEELQRHWSRQASHYAQSKTHGSATALAAVVEAASPQSSDVLLDVGTGTGFTALAFAPWVSGVIGIDLSAGMLQEAHRIAGERGITNAQFYLADAEYLPFLDGSFDIITCRAAAHHFQHIEQAICEMWRAAKSGGKVVFVDTCSPEDKQLAKLMNLWEKKRDPTHVCDRAPSEVRHLFENQGFTVEAISVQNRANMTFSDWVVRSGTPAVEIQELRLTFEQPSPEARQAFRIRVDGDEIYFGWDVVQLIGLKPQ